MIIGNVHFETRCAGHGRKFESNTSWKHQDFCSIIEKAFYACKGVDHIAYRGGTEAYFPVFGTFGLSPFVGSISLKSVREDALVFEETFPNEPRLNSLKLEDIVDFGLLDGRDSYESLENYENYRDDGFKGRNLHDDLCGVMDDCGVKTKEVVISFFDLFFDLGLDDTLDVTFDSKHKPLVHDEYDIADLSSYAVESLKHHFQDYFDMIMQFATKTYNRLCQDFDDLIWAEDDRLSHLDYTV